MSAPTADALARIYESLRSGDWTCAHQQCRDLLEQIPECAAAHHALGMSLCGDGRFEAAVIHLQRALELDPCDAARARDLAVVCAKLQRWADVARLLQLQLSALDSEAIALYLAASVEAGVAAEAVSAVRQLNRADFSGDAVFLCEYGRALHATGDIAAAEETLGRVLDLTPENIRARETLSKLYEETGRSRLGVELWRFFALLRPESGLAHLRLAMACAETGWLKEARSARLNAVRLGLTDVEYSTALYLMLFDDDESADSVLAACRNAFQGVSTPRSINRARQRVRRDSRLRVGYLSGEFNIAPAYHFIRSFLAHHDRSALELFFYNTNLRAQGCPPSYRQPGDRWRDVATASEDALLSLLDDDDLDVLVDLSGHFPNNRLSVFARRAVGLQATFPNYPCTTGCPEMDYFFTDSWTSPSGTDDQYSERLHRLPSGYLVYTPPDTCGAVAPLAARRNGYVTFGVVQRILKITGGMWDLFASILRRTPGSRLLLHYGDPGLDRPDSDASCFLEARLRERDIDPSRLTLTGRRALAEHLDLLGRIDIALDTMPFGGQTTTSECLWMGVPVVTLTGRTNVSRVSAGLIMRAGLPELVAHGPDDYVELAGRLASDVDALQQYRKSVRERCLDGGLTDGTTLAREMEQAYYAWNSQG